MRRIGDALVQKEEEIEVVEVYCGTCDKHLGWWLPDTGYNDAETICDECLKKKNTLDKLPSTS